MEAATVDIYVTAHEPGTDVLREVLARRLGADPSAVHVTREPSGKPVLRGAPFVFSFSHSAEVALVAIAPAGRLGVDVELVDGARERPALAQRLGTSGTGPALARWTVMEACAKAGGHTLARALDVEVGGRGETPSVRAPEGPWFARRFSPVPGYVAAIVGDRPLARPRLHAC